MHIIFQLHCCGLAELYCYMVSATIASGNGFLPDGTKPFPEPMRKNHKSGITTLSTSHDVPVIVFNDAIMFMLGNDKLCNKCYVCHA